MPQSNCVCGAARSRSDHHSPVDRVRVSSSPLHHLKTTHAAANRSIETRNAEVVQQLSLRLHHVPNREDGKAHRVRSASALVDVGWSGAATAAAEHVGTNHKITIGIQQ